MLSNLPGSSPGRANGFWPAKREIRPKREDVKPSSLHSIAPKTLRFGSNLDGADRLERQIDSPGSDDGFSAFMRDLYPQLQPSPPIIYSPDRFRPPLKGMNRAFSYNDVLSQLGALKENPLNTWQQKGIEPDPEVLELIRVLKGMSQLHRDANSPYPQSALMHPRSISAPSYIQTTTRSNQSPPSGVLHGAPQGVPMASHQELLNIFKIPYQYTILSKSTVRDHLTAVQAGALLKTAKTVAVGDMHASYLKLVETMVAADMIEMPAPAAREFVRLAHSPINNSMDTAQLEPFYADLKQVVSTMKWKGGNRKLILLGDMLSDRGPLDNIILDIVKHLSQQSPKSFVRLASNHDHNVLSYLVNNESYIAHFQVPSMIRAFKLAEKNTKLYTELIDNYFDYLEASKLMYFDEKSKTLFTHAPIADEQLKGMGQLLSLGSPYSKPSRTLRHPERIDNPKDVGRFADAANKFYKEYVGANWKVLSAQWDDMENGTKTADAVLKRFKKLQGIIEDKLTNEVKGFLWARNDLNQQEKLPFINAGVTTLVHGHDSNSAQGSAFSALKKENKAPEFTVFNLDQEIRKGDYIPPEKEQPQNTLFIQA